MLADAVFCHWGVLLLHCVESACRWGTAYFSQVLGEGLSAPGKCDTLSKTEPNVSYRRATTHTYKLYLMIACCNKADWQFHGNHRNASFLPVILLIELFHLHSSVVKGRRVQTFVPTSYQVLRVERLFVDGFINCSVHVFLPNLKWVRNGITSYDKTESDCEIEIWEASPLKHTLQWGRRQGFCFCELSLCFCRNNKEWFLFFRAPIRVSASLKGRVEVLTDLWRAVVWRRWRRKSILFFPARFKGWSRVSR